MKDIAKILLTFILLTSFTLSAIAQGEALKSLNQAFTTSDLSELPTILGEEVVVSLLEKEETMNKEAVVRALEAFFESHPDASFTHKHDGKARDGSSFVIGELTAGEEVFRTYAVVVDNYIIELCIDLE